MNLFCIESHAQKSIFSNLSNNYDIKVRNIELKFFKCHIIEDDGGLFGFAENENYLILYIGCISNIPLKGNKKSSDNPNDVAEYLLNSFSDNKNTYLDGIHGSYSIIILHKYLNSLFISCDISKSKPIFYKLENKNIFCSTQIYSFKQTCSINREKESFLLGYEFVDNDNSLYQNVKKIPGSVLVEFNNGVINKQTVKNNIKNISHPKLNSEKSIIKHLYNTFMTTIQEQSPTTNECAVILGGFDSALIASALKRLGKDVSTYTFHFNDSKYNQPNINLLINFMKLRHNWVHIDKSIIKNGLKNYNLYFNNIASQPHYLIHTAHIVKKIRKDGFIHSFTGDGCDGLFQGYPTVYLRTKLINLTSKIPNNILNTLHSILSHNFIEQQFGHPARISRNIVRISTRTMPVRAHIAARIFDEISLRNLYKDDVDINVENIEQTLNNLSSNLNHLSATQLAYHGKSLVGLNANKIDGSSKQNGVALLSPYMDPSFISFANSLPEIYMRPKSKIMNSNIGKYILCKMAEENSLLPREIIYQKKKSPVNSPVDDWYVHCFNNFLIDLCKHLPFNYNKKYVADLIPYRIWEKIFRSLKTIDSYTTHAICLLITYAQFCK